MCFLSDGGTLVYCAFREHWGNHWQITVCRSTDGGNNWVFDSVVDSNDNNRFLGAPYLWFSRDGTVQRLREVAAGDPCVKVVFLRSNFGQTGALSAGLRHASGEALNPAYFRAHLEARYLGEADII